MLRPQFTHNHEKDSSKNMPLSINFESFMNKSVQVLKHNINHQLDNSQA
jgi:hypothetical protein